MVLKELRTEVHILSLLLSHPAQLINQALPEIRSLVSFAIAHELFDDAFFDLQQRVHELLGIVRAILHFLHEENLAWEQKETDFSRVWCTRVRHISELCCFHYLPRIVE